MKKLLKAFSILSIITVVGVIAAATWFASQQSSLTWLIKQVPQWTDGAVTIEQATGQLLKQVSLEGIHYQKDDMDVVVNKVDFSWRSTALFLLTLHVKQLHVAGVAVQLPPSAAAEDESPPDEESEPFTGLPDINLPIDIILDDIQVHDITIQQAEAEKVQRIDSILLRAQITDHVELENLVIHAPEGKAKLAGFAGLTTPHPIDLDLTWQAQIEGFPQAVGEGKLSGSSEAYKLTHNSSQPLATNIVATVKNVFVDPTWEADIHWENLQYPFDKTAELLVNSPTGRINSTGTLNAYTLAVDTQVEGASIPRSTWQLNGKGSDKHFKLEKLAGSLLTGEVTASGLVHWAPAITADLQLEGEHLVLTELVDTWNADLPIDAQIEVNFAKDTLTIKQLTAQLPPLETQLTVVGEVDLKEADNPQFDTQLTWENIRYPLEIDEAETVALKKGDAHLKGDLTYYKVALNTALSGAQIPKGQWSLTGEGDLEHFIFDKLSAEILEGTINATGRAAWKEGINAKVALDTDSLVLSELWEGWDPSLHLNSQTRIQFIDNELKIEQLDLSLPETNTTLKIAGDALLADALEDTRFDVNIDWENARFPLTGKQRDVEAKKGQLQLSGLVSDYKLKLHTALAGEAIPTGNWQATGQGDLQHFTLDGLHGNILKGKVNLAGNVAWDPAINWDFTLTGDKLRPQQKWRELKGRLKLAVATQGSIANTGELKTTLNIKHVKGSLQGYPLNLNSQLVIDGDQYHLKKLRLRSGKTRLDAQAKIADKVTGKWTLNAPNLKTLYPEAQGSIRSNGTLSGTIDNPRIQAKINAKKLGFAETIIQTLNLNSDIYLDENRPLKLDLVVDKIRQADKLVLKKLTVTGKGKVKNHRVTTKAVLADQDILLQLVGGFNTTTQKWLGQLSQLDIKTKKFGNWGLNAPAKLALAAEKVSLNQLCLMYQAVHNAGVCATADWRDTGATNLAVNLKQLPLSIANKVLPAAKLSGTLQGNVKLAIDSRERVNANSVLTLSRGQIKTVIDDTLHTFHHGGGEVKLNIDRTGLSSNVELAFLDASYIKGSLALPRFNRLTLSPNQAIQGRIDARIAELNLLPAFVAQIEKATGFINARLGIGGTIAKPELNGFVNMADVNLDIPEFGLELRGVQAKLDAQRSEYMTLTAGARSGEGSIQAKGAITLASFSDWQTKIKLTGKAFEAINTPDVHAKISPDLDIAIAPQDIKVTGKVFIPYAQITPSIVVGEGQGGGGVGMSKDVRVVNPITPQPQEEEKPASPWKITTYVDIILGNQVDLEVVGFKSHFGGHVTVIMQPNKEVILGNGEIEIVNGTYKAYGQDLEIRRGFIVFAGGDITNPGLNIKAKRDIQSDDSGFGVTEAGVHITGTAKTPKVSLFSSPRVEESEILSYILTGAALSSGDITKTKLSLGTYIMPSLYVGFGIGIFDKSKVFTLRYDVNKKWAVETVIGEKDRGIDFSYKLER